MEAVNVTIGPLVFDHADYDSEGDVLYLHVGVPQDAEGEETPEGHVLRFEPDTKRIVGLTVINARSLRLDLPPHSGRDLRYDRGTSGRPRVGSPLIRLTT